jgi:hypothetical protein
MSVLWRRLEGGVNVDLIAMFDESIEALNPMSAVTNTS